MEKIKHVLPWVELVPRQVWTMEYVIPGFKSRTTVFTLSDGSFLVYSPGVPVLEPFCEHFRAAPSFLLLPNAFHHLGAKAWQEKFPQAELICADGAKKRLIAQGHSALSPLSLAATVLPATLEILEPAGSRYGETWIAIKTPQGIIWVVCDAFFNMPRLAKKLTMRIIQIAIKAAPGLRVSQLVKWGLVKDRTLYKKWILQRLKKDQPIALVPAHGDILEGSDLPRKIAAVMEERF